MKLKLRITIITCLVLLFSTARADDTSEFPRIGVEYRMLYSTPKVTTINNKDSTEDRFVTLRIIKVLHNGWVLASSVSYKITRSAPTEQNRFGEVIDRKKEESEPRWFNLNAFSEATELKEK